MTLAAGATRRAEKWQMADAVWPCLGRGCWRAGIESVEESLRTSEECKEAGNGGCEVKMEYTGREKVTTSCGRALELRGRSDWLWEAILKEVCTYTLYSDLNQSPIVVHAQASLLQEI